MFFQHFNSREIETGLLLLTEASARGLLLGPELSCSEMKDYYINPMDHLQLLFFISDGNFYITMLSSYESTTNKPLLYERQIKLM